MARFVLPNVRRACRVFPCAGGYRPCPRLRTSLFGDPAERWFADRTWSSRKQAEKIAERIEAFALEEQLGGGKNIGTIATKVVPAKDGHWGVEINELRRPGGPWITALSEDQFNPGRDDSEGEEWKD